MLRRRNGETPEESAAAALQAGLVRMDERHGHRDGGTVPMPKEFDLLELLLRNAGRVLTMGSSSTSSGL